MRILIPLFILVIVAIGCQLSQTKSENNSPFGVNTQKFPSKGGDIIVQYDEKKNTTTIYQNNFKNTQLPITVSNKPVNQRHVFDFNSTATYDGHTPAFVSENTAFTILHSIASKSLWHFSPKTKIKLVADDKQIDLPVYQQTPLEKDSPSDKDFYESLLIQLPQNIYPIIASAKSARFEIGNGSFDLSELDRARFGAFGDYLK